MLLVNNTLYIALSIIVIVLSLTIIFIAMPFTFAHIVNQAVFGYRDDKNPRLKYYTPEELELDAKPVTTHYSKWELRGYVYSCGDLEKCKKLVIFAHGFGPGQASYMTEIAYYAKCGYAVLAFDNVGCNLSEGKNIRGFAVGIDCLVAACLFAKSHEVLCDLPIVLVGHSWGAYSALCVASIIKVQGVVAFSAFSSPSKAIANGAEFILGKKMPLIHIMRPAICVVNFLKFGRHGNMNAAKAISRSQTPALLIHGELDKMVPPKNAVAYKVKNKQTLLEKDKQHNPYNTVEAEKKLQELRWGITEEKSEDWFLMFDYDAATREDERVMNATREFIELL